MALLSIQNVRVSFGGPLLLDNANLQLEHGERVCLLGRNGAGKSTFMKFIHGDLMVDAGEIVRQQDTRISFLPQEVPHDLHGNVFDLVASGLGPLGASLTHYQNISAQVAQEGSNHKLLADLDRVQQTLDANGGWLVHQQVEQVLSHLHLDPNAAFETLSGGLKRRTLLAAALVSDPDLLLLDEPTNHLDIASISWLEDFLVRREKALLFVTHDRMLLRKLATRIVELDRAQLTSWSCDYETFLERKQAALEEEAVHWARFDKKLAEEEVWIRRGIRARRTRNEGRVRALHELRAVRQARREKLGTARLQIQEGEQSGKLVVEAQDVSYAYADQAIVHNFSARIMRGDKIGIIGPNGCGKTTLLRLLLGELSPQHGTIQLGTRLSVAYFDQLRTQLDEEKTVQEIVSDGHDTITFNGQSRHIISYLGDFLFPPDRARSPIRILSGGERNRLLLARLFTKPSNILVLDEPTNDLDAETMELLEELLLEYQGTVLLVSHDRALLNNVVTSTFAFEDDGQVYEYIGGYDDWFRQRRSIQTQTQPAEPKREKQRPQRERPKKLSYKEQRELEALPEHIEQLETAQTALHQQLADPELYKQNGSEIGTLKSRLTALEQELEAAYTRWEALEAIQHGEVSSTGDQI
jgi:ATP-binding cassette subfamily F protein uup